jgi:hypothetical protein
MTDPALLSHSNIIGFSPVASNSSILFVILSHLIPIALRKEQLTNVCNLFVIWVVSVGRDSSDGIAIRYGLHSPGTEPRCGRDYPHTSRLDVGPTQPPI